MSFQLTQSDKLHYAKLFGVDPTLIEKAEGTGITLEMSHSSPGVLEVRFAGIAYGKVLVKASAITLAKNGNMGPASKGIIRKALEEGIKVALSHVSELPKAYAPPYSIGGDSFSTSISMSPGKKAAFTKMLNKQKALGVDSVPQNITKLSQATNLLQPVEGTSEGSIYRVVAMLDGVNVAVRRTHGNLSIRVEGPKLSTVASSLIGMGFSLKPGYASVHFQIVDQLMVNKAVGAVVGALGMENLKMGVSATEVGMS